MSSLFYTWPSAFWGVCVLQTARLSAQWTYDPDFSASSFAVGAIVQEGIAEFPLSSIRNPDTGEPGVVAEFLDA